MADVEVQKVKHAGGCHCGAVRFEVFAPRDVDVYDCNCSVCVKKANRHFIVPESDFKLLQGSDSLTTYTYNTRQAKHTFCSKCGVQSFYTPRSNPDGRGVCPHCIDAGTIGKIKIITFDGINWESCYEKDTVLQSRSK